MYLIVGLGNPGREYEKTRHNAGFELIDKYANHYGLEINKKKLDGLFVKSMINNQEVILMKPQLYINLSGNVIKKYLDYFDISVDNLLIISDDLDQEIGSYKLKPSGSSGGHNGLKDIESHLKTKDYKRLKLGISNNKLVDTKNYVLGSFSKSERQIIDKNNEKLIKLLDDYLEMSFDKLMAIYNYKEEKNDK